MAVTSLGEMICNGFTLVTSEEIPLEEELELKGEEAEGLAFSLKIPDGEYNAYLWNAASDELIEGEATGGDFDFELPRLGSWYWFNIKDKDGEQPFGLWMKAE